MLWRPWCFACLRCGSFVMFIFVFGQVKCGEWQCTILSSDVQRCLPLCVERVDLDPIDLRDRFHRVQQMEMRWTTRLRTRFGSRRHRTEFHAACEGRRFPAETDGSDLQTAAVARLPRGRSGRRRAAASTGPSRPARSHLPAPGTPPAGSERSPCAPQCKRAVVKCIRSDQCR